MKGLFLTFRWLAITAMFFLAAVSLLGFFGAAFWLFDLFAHFRVHYIVIGVLLFPFCFLRRSWWVCGMCLGAIAINTLTILPYLWLQPPAEGPSELRVVQINVLRSNRDTQPAIDWIRQQDADIVVVQETDERWLTALNQGLSSTYSHRQAQPMDNNFGMAVFSRFPLVDPETSLLVHMAIPCLFSQVDTPKGPVRLLAVHPPPPMSGFNSKLRDATLERLVPRVAQAEQAGEAVLVVGDLNATPWSHAFRAFVKKTGMVDTQRWSGLQPTWKAKLGRVGIPIDHVLISKEFEVVRRDLGPHNGSDHLPVVVDLRYK